MNTELDRSEAKGAIVNRESHDPELDHVMSSAHLFQLGVTKEQNRHAETMRGAFSRLFGQGDNTATFIAACAMFFGIVITIGCYTAIALDKSTAEFWAKQAERSLAFTSTCLAFIFGKGLSKS